MSTDRLIKAFWIPDSALAGFMALFFFLCCFGQALLNPEHIGWLLEANHQDSIQHFVGWEFFRYEPWHFPLGIIRNYGHPIPTSIIYTDSIPILAFIFKCFSKILPENFQYFGLWYVLCFILQAGFASALSSQITTNKIIKISISLFFLLSPIMLNRMEEHQSLVAHWVILAGFYLYFFPYKKSLDRYWLGLNALTLLIHAYLAVMVLILWNAYLLKQILIIKNMSYYKGIKIILSNSTILIILAWLTGYFVLPMASLKTPLAFVHYSMNMLSPFVPTSGAVSVNGNWSLFFTTFYPSLFGQRTEGFNYLGIGMLLLICLALVCLLKKLPHKKTMLAWLPLLIVCSLMAMYSLSSTVYLGQHSLFSYSLPFWLSDFADIFRASGRFFWPMYYLLMLMTFTILCSRLKPQVIIPLLALALALQGIDLSNKIDMMKKKYQTPINATNNLTRILSAKKGYHKLVFLPQMRSPAWDIKGFSEYIHYAARHNMMVNQGYFAREDSASNHKAIKQLEEEVYQGHFSKDTIYIIVTRSMISPIKAQMAKNIDTIQIGPYMVIFG